MAKNKNKGKPRNYALESGVYRFGKSATYHKKAIYKFAKKTAVKKAAAKSPIFVEKKIGGAKSRNGVSHTSGGAQGTTATSGGGSQLQKWQSLNNAIMNSSGSIGIH